MLELYDRLHTIISKGIAMVDDQTALKSPEVYPSWEWLVKQDYEVKQEEVPMRFQFGGALYKCIKSGKMFKSEWVPGVGTASIFVMVANDDESGTITLQFLPHELIDHYFVEVAV